MSMDWENPLAMFGLSDSQQPSQTGNVDEYNDDFYGGDTRAGVSAVSKSAMQWMD